MGTTLHTLSPNPGATRAKKRVGRGRGSGTGKTSGRGVKGQKARAGHHGPIRGFEGGQMPLKFRLPKRGFKNPFRIEAHGINVGLLSSRFEGGVVDLEALSGAGLLPKGTEMVKILGNGEITKALKVKAHAFSKTAVAKIEAAGGSVEVIPTRTAPPEE